MKIIFFSLSLAASLTGFGQVQKPTQLSDTSHPVNLNKVTVVARRPFVEQKTDRLVVNVDASPSNTGSTIMDVLEKSPEVSVDKDGNISLKGKQNVLVMIDDKPTYMSATQLASYLKGLPASSVDQLEIMTNPSAKYDAAGNSGIINLKTKKNRIKGFNGSVTANYTQGYYGRPGASANLNYRNGKWNVFANAGFNRWAGKQDLYIDRNYFSADGKQLTSIFNSVANMHYKNPEANLKLGADYDIDKMTNLGVVLSGYGNQERQYVDGMIYLRDANSQLDSVIRSTGNTENPFRSYSANLNFRHKFDTAGTELTADLDYGYYASDGSRQNFGTYTYLPDMTPAGETHLEGKLPSTTRIYAFKSDFTRLFGQLKMEAGIKTSYVSTDNAAEYFVPQEEGGVPDSGKTNYFLYHENINAAYLNFSRKIDKWTLQAGLRLENTNYAGHQLGNPYTAVRHDSTFSKSYVSAFPTVFASYKANEKNTFGLNFGRRIDRPDYSSLNPFVFYIDAYTYGAGNPYLQPQFTTNAELSHTYAGVLTTTLNYSHTRDLFAETFEQAGHATIDRQGNIGTRDNYGIAVSYNQQVIKWWNLSLYANLGHDHYRGVLYGENVDLQSTIFMANMNNSFSLGKGWSTEVSGFYRSAGLEGQIRLRSMGALNAGLSKQVFKGKGTLKVGVRDILNTRVPRGEIDFQQTQAFFRNVRDNRQVSVSFVYRFGKMLPERQARQTGGASEEASRVKSGGNN